MRRTPLATIFLSFFAGLLVMPVLLWIYLSLGRPPVAVEDAPFPFERELTHVPLAARIRREIPAQAPIPASDENLIGGAGIYEDKCEVCHGTQGERSGMARTMAPSPPQLFDKHRNGDAVGVSDDPVGETYWKVKNGIRLTGMPAFGKALTEKQLWQVSLLLSKADKPLPDEAAKIVGQK